MARLGVRTLPPERSTKYRVSTARTEKHRGQNSRRMLRYREFRSIQETRLPRRLELARPMEVSTG